MMSGLFFLNLFLMVLPVITNLFASAIGPDFIGCAAMSNLSVQPVATPAHCFYRCAQLGQARVLLLSNASCNCANEATVAGLAYLKDKKYCPPCPGRPQLLCGSDQWAAVYSISEQLPSGRVFVSLTSALQLERTSLNLAIETIGLPVIDDDTPEFTIQLHVHGLSKPLSQPLIRRVPMQTLLITLEPVFIHAGPLNFSVTIESVTLGPLLVASTVDWRLSQPVAPSLPVVTVLLGNYSEIPVQSANNSLIMLVENLFEERPNLNCLNKSTDDGWTSIALFTMIDNKFAACLNWSTVGSISVLSQWTYRVINVFNAIGDQDISGVLKESDCDRLCCYLTYSAVKPGLRVIQITGPSNTTAAMIVNFVPQLVANVTMRLLGGANHLQSAAIVLANTSSVYQVDFFSNFFGDANLNLNLFLNKRSIFNLTKSISHDPNSCLIATNFTTSLPVAGNFTAQLSVSNHYQQLASIPALHISVYGNLATDKAAVIGPDGLAIPSLLDGAAAADYKLIGDFDTDTRFDWWLMRLPSNYSVALLGNIQLISQNDSARLLIDFRANPGRLLLVCRLSNPASILTVSKRLILIAMPTAGARIVGFESRIGQSGLEPAGCPEISSRTLPTDWSGRVLISLATDLNWQPLDLHIEVKVHLYSHASKVNQSLSAERLNSTHFAAWLSMPELTATGDEDDILSLTAVSYFGSVASLTSAQAVNVSTAPSLATMSENIESVILSPPDAGSIYQLTVTLTAGASKKQLSLLSVVCRPECQSFVNSTTISNKSVIAFRFYFINNSSISSSDYGIVSLMSAGLARSQVVCDSPSYNAQVLLRRIYVNLRKSTPDNTMGPKLGHLQLLSSGDTDPVLIGFADGSSVWHNGTAKPPLGLWSWTCYNPANVNQTSVPPNAIIQPADVFTLAISRSLIVNSCELNNVSVGENVIDVNLKLAYSVENSAQSGRGTHQIIIAGADIAAAPFVASGRFDVHIKAASNEWASLRLISAAQLTVSSVNFTWELTCKYSDCQVECNYSSIDADGVVNATRLHHGLMDGVVKRLSSIWLNISSSQPDYIRCNATARASSVKLSLPLTSGLLAYARMFKMQNCPPRPPFEPLPDSAVRCDQFLENNTDTERSFATTPFTVVTLQQPAVSSVNQSGGVNMGCTSAISSDNLVWLLRLSSYTETAFGTYIYSKSGSIEMSLPAPGNYSLTAEIRFLPMELTPHATGPAATNTMCRITRLASPALMTSSNSSLCIFDPAKLPEISSDPPLALSGTVELLIGEQLTVRTGADPGAGCYSTEFFWLPGDDSGADVEYAASPGTASFVHTYFRPGNYTLLLLLLPLLQREPALLATSGRQLATVARQLPVRVLPAPAVRVLALTCLNCLMTEDRQLIHLASSPPAAAADQTFFSLRTDAKFPLVARVNFGDGESLELGLREPDLTMTPGIITVLNFSHAFSAGRSYRVTVSLVSPISTRLVLPPVALQLQCISAGISIESSRDFVFVSSTRSTFVAKLSNLLPTNVLRPGYNVRWDFGDGTVSDQAGYTSMFNISHVYQTASFYRLKVSLLQPYENFASAAATITTMSSSSLAKVVLASSVAYVNVFDRIDSCTLIAADYMVDSTLRLQGYTVPFVNNARWIISKFFKNDPDFGKEPVCRPSGAIVECDAYLRKFSAFDATVSNEVSSVTCRVCWPLSSVDLSRLDHNSNVPLAFSTVAAGVTQKILADKVSSPCAELNWSFVVDGTQVFAAQTGPTEKAISYNFPRSGSYSVSVTASIGPFSVSHTCRVFSMLPADLCNAPHFFVYPEPLLIDGIGLPVGFFDGIIGGVAIQLASLATETCGFQLKLKQPQLTYSLVMRHLATNWTISMGPTVWPILNAFFSLPSNHPLGDYQAVARISVDISNQSMQPVYVERTFGMVARPSEAWLVRLLPDSGIGFLVTVSRLGSDGTEAGAAPLIFAPVVNPNIGNPASLNWSCTPFLASKISGGCFRHASQSNDLISIYGNNKYLLSIPISQLRPLSHPGPDRYVFDFSSVDWRGRVHSTSSLVEVADSPSFQLRLSIACSTCSPDYPMLADPNRDVVFRARVVGKPPGWLTSQSLRFDWALFGLLNDTQWQTESLPQTKCTNQTAFLGDVKPSQAAGPAEPVSKDQMHPTEVTKIRRRRLAFIPPIGEGGGGEGDGGGGSGGVGTSTSTMPILPTTTPTQPLGLSDSELRYVMGLGRQKLEISFDSTSFEFLIPAGKLKPNRRYLVGLSATAFGADAAAPAAAISGKAMELISTAAAAYGSECSIARPSGTAVLSDFTVHCQEYFTTILPSGKKANETHPFAYHFDYSANGGEIVNAYSGQLPEFGLRLPAGLVSVNVTVCSAFGFCNTVCNFRVSVEPLNLKEQSIVNQTEVLRPFSGSQLELEAASLNTAWLYQVGRLIWSDFANQLDGNLLANVTGQWLNAISIVAPYAVKANQTDQLVSLLARLLSTAKTTAITLPCHHVPSGLALANQINSTDIAQRLLVELLLPAASVCQRMSGDTLAVLDHLLQRLLLLQPQPSTPLSYESASMVRCRLTSNSSKFVSLGRAGTPWSDILVSLSASSISPFGCSVAQLTALPATMFPTSVVYKSISFPFVEMATPVVADVRVNCSADRPITAAEPLVGIQFNKLLRSARNQASEFAGTVKRFHRTSADLSINYGGNFNTGWLEIRLRCPPLAATFASFDMEAVINYRIVSSSHTLRPAQTGVWTRLIRPDSEHSITVPLPEYQLYDTLIVNVTISDSSAYTRLVSPMDALSQNFSLSIDLLSCFYWHIASASWKTDGCKSSMLAAAETGLECQCNHLTAFSALRLGAEMTDGLAGRLLGTEPLLLQPGVSILPFAIAATAVLLVLCLVKTLQWDSANNRAPLIVVPLPDNCLVTRSSPEGDWRLRQRLQQQQQQQQLYLVSVETGFSRFAGTNARVYISLHGAAGQSEQATRELRQPHAAGPPITGRLFGPGCRSLFLLAAPAGLHRPDRVRLWHDAADGESPSWLLRRVDICRLNDLTDSPTDNVRQANPEIFSFPCNSWLSAGSANLRTDRELHSAADNQRSGVRFLASLADWLKLAWSALHPWLAPVYRPDWLGGSHSQSLMACAAWLGAVWAAAVGLVTNLSAEDQATLDYFPLYKDFINGLPWGIGLATCLTGFSIITYSMPATRFTLRNLMTSFKASKTASSNGGEAAATTLQSAPSEQQQQPKKDIIVGTDGLANIASFGHLQSWAEQAWQMRASWALASKLIGNSSSSSSSSSNATMSMEDAISLDSIEMVITGARHGSNWMAAANESAGPTAPNPTDDEMFSTRGHIGSRTSLLAELCCNAGLVVGALGCSAWAAAMSWRFDPLQSSRSVALVAEFVLISGCLISPLACLIFAASRAAAGASVSALMRFNGRLCRQAAAAYRRWAAEQMRATVGENEAVSIYQRDRELRFAQPPSYQELAEQRTRLLRAYRSLRFAFRLTFGFLLALTLIALVCGHSVKPAGIAIDRIQDLIGWNPRTAHKLTESYSVKNQRNNSRHSVTVVTLLKTAFLRLVKCDSCQWHLIGPPQLAVWSCSSSRNSTSSSSSSSSSSSNVSIAEALSPLLSQSPLLAFSPALSTFQSNDSRRFQVLSNRLLASNADRRYPDLLPIQSVANGNNWWWLSLAEFVGYVKPPAWSTADSIEHSTWWSELHQRLPDGVCAVALTVSLYHAALPDILTTTRLLVERSLQTTAGGPSWTAAATVAPLQTQLSIVASVAMVLLLVYTAVQCAQFFASLCSKRIHRRTCWEKFFRAIWLLSLSAFATVSIIAWHLSVSILTDLSASRSRGFVDLTAASAAQAAARAVHGWLLYCVILGVVLDSAWRLRLSPPDSESNSVKEASSCISNAGVELATVACLLLAAPGALLALLWPLLSYRQHPLYVFYSFAGSVLRCKPAVSDPWPLLLVTVSLSLLLRGHSLAVVSHAMRLCRRLYQRRKVENVTSTVWQSILIIIARLFPSLKSIQTESLAVSATKTSNELAASIGSSEQLLAELERQLDRVLATIDNLPYTPMSSLQSLSLSASSLSQFNQTALSACDEPPGVDACSSGFLPTTAAPTVTAAAAGPDWDSQSGADSDYLDLPDHTENI